MIRVILEYNEDIDNSSEKKVKNTNDDYEFQLKLNKQFKWLARMSECFLLFRDYISIYCEKYY